MAKATKKLTAAENIINASDKTAEVVYHANSYVGKKSMRHSYKEFKTAVSAYKFLKRKIKHNYRGTTYWSHTIEAWSGVESEIIYEEGSDYARSTTNAELQAIMDAEDAETAHRLEIGEINNCIAYWSCECAVSNEALEIATQTEIDAAVFEAAVKDTMDWYGFLVTKFPDYTYLLENSAEGEVTDFLVKFAETYGAFYEDALKTNFRLVHKAHDAWDSETRTFIPFCTCYLYTCINGRSVATSEVTFEKIEDAVCYALNDYKARGRHDFYAGAKVSDNKLGIMWFYIGFNGVWLAASDDVKDTVNAYYAEYEDDGSNEDDADEEVVSYAAEISGDDSDDDLDDEAFEIDIDSAYARNHRLEISGYAMPLNARKYRSKTEQLFENMRNLGLRLQFDYHYPSDNVTCVEFSGVGTKYTVAELKKLFEENGLPPGLGYDFTIKDTGTEIVKFELGKLYLVETVKPADQPDIVPKLQLVNIYDGVATFWSNFNDIYKCTITVEHGVETVKLDVPFFGAAYTSAKRNDSYGIYTIDLSRSREWYAEGAKVSLEKRFYDDLSDYVDTRPFGGGKHESADVKFEIGQYYNPILDAPEDEDDPYAATLQLLNITGDTATFWDATEEIVKGKITVDCGVQIVEVDVPCWGAAFVSAAVKDILSEIAAQVQADYRAERLKNPIVDLNKTIAIEDISDGLKISHTWWDMLLSVFVKDENGKFIKASDGWQIDCWIHELYDEVYSYDKTTGEYKIDVAAYNKIKKLEDILNVAAYSNNNYDYEEPAYAY